MTEKISRTSLVSTTIISQAALWSSFKAILLENGSIEKVEPFELADITVKQVEGTKNKTKMIFWFLWHKDMKKVTVAYSNRKLLVDPNAYHKKYLDYRNLTFNKGFAGDPQAFITNQKEEKYKGVLGNNISG